MSVRKTASVRGAAGSGTVIGVQVVKTLGFWIALALASFVIGLFILSPLINVASGTHSPPTASTPPSSQAPAPRNHSAVAPITQSRRERATDSDGGISPELENRSEVQRPEPVDDGSASRANDSAARTDPNADHD